MNAFIYPLKFQCLGIDREEFKISAFVLNDEKNTHIKGNIEIVTINKTNIISKSLNRYLKIRLLLLKLIMFEGLLVFNSFTFLYTSDSPNLKSLVISNIVIIPIMIRTVPIVFAYPKLFSINAVLYR